MISQEEATKILMGVLGGIKNQSYWHPETDKYLTYEEALAHCLDLNVLAGIGTEYEWDMRLFLGKPTPADGLPSCLIRLYGHEIGIAFGNTIQEACFYATAEAIRKEK